MIIFCNQQLMRGLLLIRFFLAGLVERRRLPGGRLVSFGGGLFGGLFVAGLPGFALEGRHGLLLGLLFPGLARRDILRALVQISGRAAEAVLGGFEGGAEDELVAIEIFGVAVLELLQDRK